MKGLGGLVFHSPKGGDSLLLNHAHVGVDASQNLDKKGVRRRREGDGSL